MQVMFCAESLQRTIQTSPKDHTPILSIGNPCNSSHVSFSILTFYKLSMCKFFLNTLQFFVHIPQTNTSVT